MEDRDQREFALEVEDYSFTYASSDVKALDGITFSLRKGSFAALCGARAPVPADVWKDVNAVEARVAALAEQDAAGDAAASVVPVCGAPVRILRFLPAAVLAVLAGLAVAVAAGGLSADTFRTVALVLTGVYFAVHAVVAKIK